MQLEVVSTLRLHCCCCVQSGPQYELAQAAAAPITADTLLNQHYHKSTIMFLRQQRQALVSLTPTTMTAAPAFALLPTTDMVEVVRLHVPWSVFRTHVRQYGDSPQWKLNRERLLRHKIDHRLGELSEQELYEHYITHVKPRATRSDVGKPRHLPSAPTTSVSFAAVAGAAPLAESTIPALVHSTSRSALNPHVSSSSRNPSANSEVTMDRVALLSDSPSSTDTAFSSASSTTGRSAPSSHNEDTVLALMTEVASLRKTADLLGAALLEQRSHQTDWEKRVSSQLARLESAIADATPAGALASTRTATVPVDNDMRQDGVAGFDPCVRFGLKRRRVSVVMKASGATQCAAPASLFDPALIDQVPRDVLELLKWDDVYFEPMATPAGPNNVLWALHPDGTHGLLRLREPALSPRAPAE